MRTLQPLVECQLLAYSLSRALFNAALTRISTTAPSLRRPATSTAVHAGKGSETNEDLTARKVSK